MTVSSKVKTWHAIVLPLLGLSMVSSGCRTMSALDAPGSAEPVRITIVATNDVHGWVTPQREAFPAGEIVYGGAPAFAGYLKILRDENPGGVVLVDAGDLFQGTLLSNLSEGAVVIDAFNQLKYDAAAIGNHEFDYGPVGSVSAARDADDDPFGALKARIAQAQFPLLSVNIYEKKTGMRPRWLPGNGTMLIDRNGIRIGILGLSTPQTPQVTLAANVASLSFSGLAQEAMLAANRLRAKGADVVVAVAHAGGNCGDVSRIDDLTSCDMSGAEIFDMLNEIPEGTLDAVVAGHTHGRIGHVVRKTPVIQNWALGRAFGTIDLFVDRTSRKIAAERTIVASGIEICESVDSATQSCDVRQLRARANNVVPTTPVFRGKKIEIDMTVAEGLKPAIAQVAALQQKPLGLKVPQRLLRQYDHESPLGSLIADGLRKLANADVALMNPGGIRADMPEGDLTYGSVYEILPFDNAVAIVKVTGSQLLALLKTAYAARKGMFQVSGIEVTVARCENRHHFQDARFRDGRAIEVDRTYTVTMPDFLARGGDGLSAIVATLDASQVDLGSGSHANLREALIGHWQATREAFALPTAKRITVHGGVEHCKTER